MSSANAAAGLLVGHVDADPAARVEPGGSRRQRAEVESVLTVRVGPWARW